MADYGLGRATGSIEVNVSQLKQAQKEIAAFVASTRAELDKLKGSKGLSLLTSQMKLQIEQQKTATATIVQEAQKQISAEQAAAKAKTNSTNLVIQVSKMKIAQIQAETRAQEAALRAQTRMAAQQERAANQGYRQPMTAGMPAGMPFFAQFSLLSAAQLAGSAGQQGLSTSLMTGGAALGLIDTLPILEAQFKGITQRFKEMGGVTGVLSSAVNALLSPIGLLAAAAVGVSLVFIELNRRFEEAKSKVESYVEAQIKLNQQIAGGLTTEDIEKQLATKRRELELNNQALNSARQYQRSLEATNAAIVTAAEEITLTSPGSDRFREATARRDSAQSTMDALRNRYDAEFPRAAGGLDAVSVAVEGFTANADTLTASISELETAANSAAVQINDAAIREQRLTQERIDGIKTYADMMRRIQQMTRGNRGEMADDLEAQISTLVSLLEDETPEVQEAFQGMIGTLLDQLQLLRETADLFTEADAKESWKKLEEAAKGIGQSARQFLDRIVSATRDEVTEFRDQYSDRIGARQNTLRTTMDIQQKLAGMTFDERSKLATALERQINDLVTLLENEPEDVRAGFADLLDSLNLQQAFAAASLRTINETDVRAGASGFVENLATRFAGGLSTAYEYILEQAGIATEKSISDINARMGIRQQIGGMTQDERGKMFNDLGVELNTLDRFLQSATPTVRASFEEYRQGLISQRDELTKTATLVTGGDIRAFGTRLGQMVRHAQHVIEFNLKQGQDRMAELMTRARDAGEGFSGTLAVLSNRLRGVWAEASEAAQKVTAFADGVRDGVQQAKEEALRLARALEDRLIAAFQQTEDRLQAVSREAEDFARSRVYAIIDFLKEMEAAENDYNERIQEIQDDYDDEEADRLEDHLLEMERIRRRAQTDILNAAMRLDAIGIYEAKRKRDEELREEEEDYKLQKDRRDEAFKEQLDDEKKQFEDLKREREAAFREQLRREDEQRAIRLSREEADYQKQLSRQAQQYALEDQRRQQDYALRIAQMMQHNQILQGIVDSGLNGIRFAWNYMLGAIQQDTIGTAVGGSPVPDQGTPWAGWTGATPARAGSTSSTSVRIDSVVLGDIGDRTDDQVTRLIDRGFREFFSRGVAVARG